MATYLVERFVPASSDHRGAADRAQVLARSLHRSDAPVRYLWSARVIGDETWFCCFEAPDASLVADINRRAAFPFDRISEADIVVMATLDGQEESA